MSVPTKIGDRVYLVHAIAGEPGIVRGFPGGRAQVEWPDLPEVGITKHKIEDLVVDESFVVSQLGLDFKPIAA